MASNFLEQKARAQAARITEQFGEDAYGGTKWLNQNETKESGNGAKPSSTQSGSYESIRASNFLRQKAQAQAARITERFGEDAYGGTKWLSEDSALSADALKTLLQKVQGLEAGPSARDGLKTSGGYYSRPASSGISQKLYDQISYLSPGMRGLTATVEAAEEDLEKAETKLKTVETYLGRAQEAYAASPTEKNADVYNQILSIYEETRGAYDSSYETYTAAYDRYKAAGDQVAQILSTYQQYADSAQAAFDDWRGTIRDAAAIRQEMEQVDGQIKALKSGAARDRAMPASAAMGSRPAAGTADSVASGAMGSAPAAAAADNTAQIQQLEQLKALLQEELDWSQYYQYNDLMLSADFADKSKYATTANGLEPVLNKWSGMYTETGFNDLTYDYINRNQEALNKAMVNSIGDNSAFLGLDKSYLEQMTDEEIAIFNYLYATQGADAAYQYTAYLTKSLNQRQRMEQEAQWAAYAAEHPIGSTIFSVLSSPMKGLSYLGHFADYAADGEIDQNAAYNKFSYIPNTIRGKLTEQMESSGFWGKVGSFAYQTGLSMADFLLATGITGGNSALALTIMGSGAAADTTIAAKDRGLEDWQAFTLGAVAGLAEAVTEKWSIEALLNPKLLKDGTWKYVWKNMLTEGGEEGASDLINLFADILISQEQSEWQQSIDAYVADGMTEQEAFLAALGDQALTIGLDMLGGALSGGILSGGNAMIQGRRTSRLGSELGDLNLDKEDVQTFIEAGLKNDPSTESYQLAAQMQAKVEAGETLSDYDLARLYQANIQEQPEAGWERHEEQKSTARPQAEKKQGEADNLSDAIVTQWEAEDGAGEVSAEAMRAQAQADYRAGRIAEAEFDAIIDEVMHLEELENGTSVKTFDDKGNINAQVDNINVNVNGGTANDNAQNQFRWPAADNPAGEFYTERTDIPDGVQVGNAGQSAGVKTGQMASGTGRQGSQAYSAAKATIERQNTASNLRRQGLIQYTSSWNLGVQSGTETENVVVMPQEYWDAEMQETAQMIRAETGKNVTFTVGQLQINKRGGTHNVRGVNTGEKIIVQCDDARVGVIQIAKHEIFHDKARDDGMRLIQELKEGIQERFSDEEFDSVMDRYIDELWPIYGPADETAWEEYESAYNAILEEMLADAYAGINAFSAGATQFTETVNQFLDENRISWKPEQANGTEEPTGPPDGDRYSIETLPDGKKYVRADRQVIFGNDPDSWSEQVEDYINGRIRHGQDVTLIAEDGGAFTITTETAGKMGDNHTGSGTTMDDEKFYVKANAAVHVDELVQVSQPSHGRTTPDHGGRHGTFANAGWNYRTAFFMDFDGRYYRLQMSVANGEKGTVPYNIGEIEERSFPKVTGSSAQGGALNGKTSFKKSIPQAEQTVKQRFSYAGENADNAEPEGLRLGAAFETDDSTQIKSTDNTGTFDGSNPDIRYSPEDSDERSLAEMDDEYGPQLQAYFDPKISNEEINGNIQQVSQMDPVTQISGEEFAKGEKDLITQVEEFFAQLGNWAYNEQLGEVVLDRRGIKSDIAHGIGRKKAAAFAAVPNVIEQGLVVDYQQNWKNRGYDTAVVAAPITIGTEDHIAAVVLTRSNQTNRFYVHEVLTTKDGAMPFKTGTQNKGAPGGDAPSIFSILEQIRDVKANADSSERYSADDISEARANMTTKERDILRGVETKLLRDIGVAMGATKFTDRNYLKDVIRELSDAYLDTGTIDQQTMDSLFKQAYDQSIMVDREFRDQYEEVRKYLHTIPITLDVRDRSDIADYGDFVKSMRNRLRIVDAGGLPIDSAWRELNDMAPELFPESIAHPADQLVRMAEIWGILKIAEKSLNEYYGSDASAFRKMAREEFDRVVWDSVGELRQIRRFAEEKQQRQTESVPTTPEEAMQAWTHLKTARKTYEKAMAKHLLTDSDEIQVGRLLRGEILPEHLVEGKDYVKGILAVYEAKQEYERLIKQLSEYRKKIRADLRDDADTYLETANEWKDKKAGIAYSRETMQRNVEDIVSDRSVAKAINERYFEPVRDAEAAATKLKTRYRDRVRALNLSRDVSKGDLVSEAHAVQLYGEAMDNIRILEKARGRPKHRDGKTLEEWRGVVYKLWKENPSLDKAKIEDAVMKMRQIYDELFQMMNEVRVRWGYEPVNYRQGYFPHFQPGDGDGIMAQFGRALGIDTQVVALPTTINGLTHTFKPGIQWFGNAQERLGFNTAYDAVEGFDRYIEGVASVICQTENIQKLRALATQMRYRTSDEGIRKQVDAVYANPALTEEQKNAIISEIYEHGRFTLSHFVVEVDEYTNLLANKKSKLDRTVEALAGRRIYTAVKWLESRVGANMIAGNLTSALTNFIPLTQAGAQLSKKVMLQGMWDTLASYRTDDAIISRSSFLTNRRGSDPIVKSWSAKVSEVLGKPMELIDSFVAGSIVRAAYRQNLKRGLSESEAIHQADIFASRVMAERSKGGMPTLFESKNPLFKLVTQFQLEVNNQFSEVFKDIPRANRDKGLRALALVLLQYFLGAWLFNNLYEKLIGRRPAMDPIDILLSTVDDLFGPDAVGVGEAGLNLANNILEDLPFSSALTLIGIETDGGRIPVSSAIPDLTALWGAAMTKDWSAEKRWKEAQDELNKLAYVIPPFGGNQVSKIWKGIKAYIEGGSYSVDSDGNDILQYPVYNDESGDFWGLVQAMLLGKSALPEAQEWVEDGFDSFSAKQTAMYQDMVEAGVSEREAYEFLDSLRAIQATEEETRKSLQMEAILDSNVPGAAKAIAYYGLLDKDEKNRAVMDELADIGANMGEAADVLIQLRNANNLKGAEKKKYQADMLIGSALTEEEKEIIIRSWLDDEEVNENGNLTNLGKFNVAMKQGVTTDVYLRFRATTSEMTSGEKAGMLASWDLAVNAKQAIFRNEISDSREDSIAAFQDAGLSFDQFLEAYSKYGEINDADLNATEKAVRFSHWIKDQGYTAEQAAVVKSRLTYFNMTPASSSRYDELVAAGMDPDEALELTGTLGALEPEEEGVQVSDLQKWRASVDFSDDVEDQLAALSAVMTDTQFQKVEIANNFGVSPDAYVTLQEIKSGYDSDGNGHYKNTEIQAAIDSLPGYYTTKQKAVLWQLATGSTSARNNPYSRQVGQQVLDARKAAKEAAEQEEEIEGLTLGNW